MQKITVFLWFDTQAEEAMLFYTSIFKNSKRGKVIRYGEGGDTVLSATFELDGKEYTAFNGGPHFSFTPAISLFVSCESQGEVDEYWEKLSEGGDPDAQRCGWLKDKFGLSWQIIPTELMLLLGHENPEIANNAKAAMMQMRKIDIQTLMDACN